MTIQPRSGVEKRCNTCERFLPIERFSRNIKRHDGRQTRCKECDRAYARDRYQRTKKEQAAWPVWIMELA